MCQNWEDWEDLEDKVNEKIIDLFNRVFTLPDQIIIIIRKYIFLLVKYKPKPIILNKSKRYNRHCSCKQDAVPFYCIRVKNPRNYGTEKLVRVKNYYKCNHHVRNIHIQSHSHEKENIKTKKRQDKINTQISELDDFVIPTHDFDNIDDFDDLQLLV